MIAYVRCFEDFMYICFLYDDVQTLEKCDVMC